MIISNIVFKDNHWSWGEHEANDDSETEEESDYSEVSGNSSSGEDDGEDSEDETKDGNDEKLLQDEDLRLSFKSCSLFK